VAGQYYHCNSLKVFNTKKYIENLFINNRPFEICLYSIKIFESKKEFYFKFVISNKIKLIELRNLPKFVKTNLNKPYEIKGRMISRSFIEVSESTLNSSQEFDFTGETVEGMILKSNQLKIQYPAVYNIVSNAFANEKKRGKTFSCGEVLEIEAIRSTSPKFIKLFISAITAIIVCCLFLKHFKYSNKSLIYRIEN